MSGFNYECDGQMSIFDYIPKQNTQVRNICLLNENAPCNIFNTHDVAKDMGIDCQYGCCNTCKYKNDCGARCNNWHITQNKIYKRACAATRKDCDCYCGTDKDMCCQSCVKECEHRCEYSLYQPKVYDKEKGGTKDSCVYNKNCINEIVMMERVILRGSGFVDGKKRILSLYGKDMSSKEREKAIKEEYGFGGAGWPLKGYGLHGYDSFNANSLRIEYRDAQGEHEKYIAWPEVEKIIEKLVKGKMYKAD